MKKHIILAMSALLALGFTACSDEDSVTKGEWNAVNGYADIAFEENSTSVELDPADPTSYTLHMIRANKEGAISVPVEITAGDKDIFSIAPAQFAAGDSIADVVISFPNAEIGTSYTIQYAVTDPKFVSYYSNAATGTFSVTRVKWNPAGYVETAAGKEEGWAMYTDDFITGIYSVENVSYPVEVQERDDQPGIFRIKNPYDGKYPYNDPGDWDESQDYYIVINATNPNKVYIDPYDFYLGLAWSYGAFVVRNLAGYRVANGQDASDYYGKYENGAITFPASSFYIGMDEYNGGGFRWYANPNGAFRLLLDPSKDKYITSLNELGEEGDFQWEEVFTGAFTSGKNGSSGTATLYKATCTVDTDDCDSLFAEAYGTPYVLEAPYAEGYDIYFFVKNGRITMPADFAEDYEVQPIGLTDNMGNDIYAMINPSSSSFAENEVVLNITFQNEDGSIVYGTANETLANITWSKIATGTFYYNFFTSNEDETPEADPGYDLLKRDDRNDKYQIAEWLMGNDGFYFSWNQTTNACAVDYQPTYYEHPKYGMIYIIEGADYDEEFGETTSFYDPETKTFHFFPVYFVEAGYFGQFEEVFEITEEGAVKHKSSRRLETLSTRNVTKFELPGVHFWMSNKAAKQQKTWNKWSAPAAPSFLMF